MGIKITNELVKFVYLNTPDKCAVERELDRLYDIISNNLSKAKSVRDLKNAQSDFDMLMQISEVLKLRGDFESDEIDKYIQKSSVLIEKLEIKREYIRRKRSYSGIYIYA
ncbi:hypothetical protein EAL2_c02850 [Peptoclostridium acidaminophilum DSM 3953]|uniref:Uncharacterized protein n=1 Tax=Peptoclostridium acidaminophilum DSM 3953 TaxID=1286171 RepID=W8TCQ9_PEPAC|nr:hypothetical protein [Peptoclostridium acidaminophilum]AHM55588.1 hypothetical protein EAL2_c02850 [Peptoclostridium acidaminophilum DSM 3953]